MDNLASARQKDVCPICKTQKDGEVTIVAIIGTGDNPDEKFQNYEAKQVHIDCLDLWLDKKTGTIFQRRSWVFYILKKLVIPIRVVITPNMNPIATHINNLQIISIIKFL